MQEDAAVLVGTPPNNTGPSDTAGRTGRWTGLFTRFTAGSAVATGCSQVMFLLVYGVFQAGATLAGALAFLAGAVPNFLINRWWTWGRRGRVRLRGELAPYLGVIAFNGLLAVGLTTGVEPLVTPLVEHRGVRAVVLGIVFGGSYVLLFVVKFLLLDRLVFGAANRRDKRCRAQVPTSTRP